VSGYLLICCASRWHRIPIGVPKFRLRKELSVLDIVYVLAAIAVFAVVALVARGVEKL